MTDDFDAGRSELLRAVRYVAEHRPLFALGIVVLSAGSALLSGIGVGFIVPIVELARDSSAATGDTGRLTGLFVAVYGTVGVPLTLETAIAGVGLVMATRYTLSFVVSYLQVKLRMSFVGETRLQAAESALSARLSYYDDHGSDEIINAIVTQANYAGGFITNSVDLLQAVLVTLVYIGVAFYLAPQLALVTAVVFVFVAGLVRLAFGSGYDAGEEVAQSNELVQEAVQSSTQGIRAVKLFGLRGDFYSEIKTAVGEHVDAVVRQTRDRAAFRELQQLASSFTVFGLLYLGIAVFTVPLAQLAAFLFAMFRLAPKISGINDIFYRAEGDLPHVVRMREFTESLEEHTEAELDPDERVPVPDSVEEVAFENATFTYENDDAPAIRDVSFEVTRPEFVALVGQSGAGKSTVVSLLARLYELDSGAITAEGTRIDRFELPAWRDRLAVVRQQPYIFDDTLRFNLRVGNRDATEAELERACEIAQVTEFLDGLPNGLDTRLGDDGVKLSGGQRQRVAIARALLKDADVLVLDEATSDLDTRLEEKVHRAIEEMDRDFMTVAIAHRLSTVLNADRIYVFEDGEIVERGTHDELVAEDGPYSELYAVQASA